MRVLSLFDGMSCGRLALHRAGFDVSLYFASEIDEYAIKVTQANFPDTIQLGDVTQIDGNQFPKIDLMIGGSPCQGFSFAGKQLNFDDPRSMLFFEFVRLLKEVKPKYFLLENVVMKKEYQDVISSFLGVQPIKINSALVSAQNRNRLYWTNIPNVEQPADKGLLLRDVLEDEENLGGRVVGRKVNPATGKRDDHNGDLKTLQRVEPRKEAGKSGTITTAQKDSAVILSEGKVVYKKNYVQWDRNGKGQNQQRDRAFYPNGKHGTLVNTRTDDKTKVLVDRDKSYCVDANYYKGGNLKQYFEKSRRQLVFIVDALYNSNTRPPRVYTEKAPTIRAGRSGLEVHKGLHYRKLSVLECERLQTVPDNYTNHVSKTQRYRMLGNGWTVDVIAHILRGMK